MSKDPIVQADEELVLRAQMADIAQLVGWIDRAASRHGMSRQLKFAMDLCLEEVFSNIVLHGYAGRTGCPVTVRLSAPAPNYFLLTVEDEATHFNPLEPPELPALTSQDEVRVGGQGIRLLRQFTNTLEYEATPRGNRLKLGFSATGSSSLRQ